MTNSTPARAEANPEPDPELDIEPPPGVRLEHPDSSSVLVHVQIPKASRALLALPRIVFLVGIGATVLQAWRHQVFFAFWIIGLPFVRWIFGSAQKSLLIGQGTIRIDGMRWFGGSLLIQRNVIKAFEVSRGNAFQSFQWVLWARTVDDKTAPLLVGASPAQAEFVNGGLQRWLAGEG